MWVGKFDCSSRSSSRRAKHNQGTSQGWPWRKLASPRAIHRPNCMCTATILGLGMASLEGLSLRPRKSVKLHCAGVPACTWNRHPCKATDNVGEMSWNCSMCRTTVAELGRASLGSCTAASSAARLPSQQLAYGIQASRVAQCIPHPAFLITPFASARPRLVRPALSDMPGHQ
jgi:hypothetical protein